jgi:hypothetical protein
MAAAARFALVANPGSARALGFAAACRSQGFPDPVLVPWQEVLGPGFDAPARFADARALRIETPAEHPQVERLILARGTQAIRDLGIYPALSEKECLSLPDDSGELRYQPQWYAGWRLVLADIEQACMKNGIRPMNRPAEIGRLFDKELTRIFLSGRDVPIPPDAGFCKDFGDLVAKMNRFRWDRVFLKPCHGSSASGVMAISRTRGERWQAVTSAVLDTSGGVPRILNSKRPLRLTDPVAIRGTVDLICRQRALVERWFPKAMIGGMTFDLRILVIAGQTAHVAVRTSSTPITNLHLRNRRGDPAEVVRRIGEQAWQTAMETAEAAAACFPGCHYCGVDLMLGARHFRSAVAEVNAFGDHLHHERWQGMNPWEAELALWRKKQA